MPTHLLFLGLIYPIAGIVLAGFSFGYNLFPMLLPLATGFALIGPIVAIGLYEISRQREEGNEPDTKHVLDVVRSPSFPAIATISAILAVLFVTWLIVAQSLYQSLLGYRQCNGRSKRTFAGTALGFEPIGAGDRATMPADRRSRLSCARSLAR